MKTTVTSLAKQTVVVCSSAFKDQTIRLLRDTDSVEYSYFIDL